MTLQNKLIKEAKTKPEFIEINSNQIKTLVNDICANLYWQVLDRQKLRQDIIAGKTFILGVQIRVRGYPYNYPAPNPYHLLNTFLKS